MMIAYQGKRVAILGFGRAGRAATDFLLERGAHVSVFAEDGEPSAEYEARGVDFHIGAFPKRFDAELLVRSPGIRPDVSPILESTACGSLLTSETELFFAHTRARIIGVTGSDGKTTTANLIAHLLRGAGHVAYLGGNNGTPLLPHALEMSETDFAVVELSSFQLMTLAKSPEIAVITNITPNHLNWHTDMAEYEAAKRRIFRFGARKLIVNAKLTDKCADSSVPTSVFAASGNELIITDTKGQHRLPVPDTFLPIGQHNRENLAAAYAAVRDFVTPQEMRAALADFRGVPHRLQTVDRVGGVTYINSSIDTSPSRTAAALSALSGKPIVIAGGKGKGVPLSPLADALAAHAKRVCLYGETAAEIEKAIKGRVQAERHVVFADAFRAAAKAAEAGDVVLLSPGCTAFDQFRDFEERGEVFCRMVADLKKK